MEATPRSVFRFSPAAERSHSFSSASTNTPTIDLDNLTLLNLSPNLVIPATPARETSEFFDSLNNLDPIKFSPPDSSHAHETAGMTDLAASYPKIATKNPFCDERYTRFGDFYETEASTDSTNIMDRPPKPPPKPGHKSPYMSHSQSESHIDFRSNDAMAHKIRVGKMFAPRGDHQRSSEDTDNTAVSSVFSRGRSISRTPSPAKVLEDIKEVCSPTSPPNPAPRKRSRSPMKKLFGEMGRLGKSMSMKDLPSQEYRKKGFKHWGGKVKERVENLTDDVSKLIPASVSLHSSPSKSSPSKTPPKSKFHVSLTPPMQAKLYADIELMICATANHYLNIQKDAGRMSVESVAKVMQFWVSKNRPQVIEFQFDQATQRDLILYNLKSFRFYGPNADNIVSMNSMMQSWKSLAREMAVRTFCTPDSVIRKHMHDSYKILEMLGAPLVTFLAFQEIQIKALKVMRDEQQRKDKEEAIEFGVEKKWEPPTRTSKDGELENPFN
ncbi:hypothetical protein P7C71_g4802, partial [Lecanoromycetidae sp. Uapishka_2]